MKNKFYLIIMIAFLAIYATGNLNAATITFDADYPHATLGPDHEFQTIYDTGFMDVQFDPKWVYRPIAGEYGDLDGVLSGAGSYYIDFIATQGSTVFLQDFSIAEIDKSAPIEEQLLTFKIYDLSDLSTSLGGMDDFDVPYGNTHYVYTYEGPGSAAGLRIVFEDGIWFNAIDNINVTATGSSAIPEPATLLLFGSGLLGLAGACRKRK